MITLENADNALKDVYLTVLKDQLDNIDGFISMIEKTTRDVYGKNILVPYFLSDEEDDFNYVQFTSELANIYGYIEISDKAVRAAQNSAGAFVNLLNSEMESMLKETNNHIINAIYDEDKKPKYYPKDKKYEPLALNGLKEIFDTEKETLYGVNRKNYNLNPVVKNMKEFNLPELEEIIDNHINNINFLICSPQTKRIISQYMIDNKQNISRKELPDRHYYMQLNDNVIIQTYKDMSDNEIWLVNSNDFKFHQLRDWQWMDDENGNILKQVNSLPLYKATLVKYANLMCHNVNGQIKIILEARKRLEELKEE